MYVRPDDFKALTVNKLYWVRLVSLLVPLASHSTVRYFPAYTPYEIKISKITKKVMNPMFTLGSFNFIVVTLLTALGHAKSVSVLEIIFTSLYYVVVSAAAQASREASNHSVEGLRARADFQFRLFCLRYSRCTMQGEEWSVLQVRMRLGGGRHELVLNRLFCATSAEPVVPPKRALSLVVIFRNPLKARSSQKMIGSKRASRRWCELLVLALLG